MPTYDYRCERCGDESTSSVKMEMRHGQSCARCRGLLKMVIRPVPGKIVGQIAQGGGPDRVTAELLNIPLKELPPGLKS